MKTKRFSRILSVFLCLAMILTIAVQGVASVSAASEVDVNLLACPGFEEEDSVGSSHIGGWNKFNTVSRSNADHYSGSYCGALTAANSSLEQDISGLVVGTTYTVSVWAKRTDSGSGTVYVGAKNFGGEEIKRAITSKDWEQITFEFTYSSSANSARIFAWSDESASTVTAYVDDYKVTVAHGISHAKIENGQIDIEFAADYDGTPSASEFTANYRSTINETAQSLPLTVKTSENKKVSLGFTPIAKAAVEQTISVDLIYTSGSIKQTISLDYTLEADKNIQVVDADLESIEVENGTIKAILDKAPTIAPVLDDFTISAKLNGEDYDISVSKYSYDAASKTATITYISVAGSPVEDRKVDITVIYNETEKSGSFTIAKGNSSIYYVSNTGDDNNNGTSPETPFATIDKLNQLTFNPGDQILFKKGDTFTGTFKPNGSGIEGYPIVIASYGEGDERPVLHPATEAWSLPYLRSADTLGTSGEAMANGCIYLYNVQYWDIKDLELEDTSYNSSFYDTNSLTVYNSGIRVGNLNMGDLKHFYFDNLVIHGFRGPGSNIGKTSGGINYNVYVTMDPDVDVRSAIVDMKVTNCEIYECGRSGINFLNSWAYRTESKWGGCGTGRVAYPYYPHRDFYMANNLIHDIDGDGLIVDNVSNAVVEYNLCYRTAIHLGSMGAAVGFFNWNSDDTIFQYNEVYNTGLNATQSNGSNVVPGDSMGIEVDALNDRTWVQYNYVHDNFGGFMMWCNIGSTFKGFDAIVRYNISESDRVASSWGYLRFCGWEYGSEFYNNILYLDPDTCLNSAGDINLVDISSGNHQTRGHMKLYNNIFYYSGETPKAANTFSDTIENYADWQSNIFYNFTNCPITRNESHPNIIADPEFINPGSGVDGTTPGVFCDLSGYKVQSGSPAINAGVPLASMWDKWGGLDFFGNPLRGIIDIGVYESNKSLMILESTAYSVNQEDKTITVSEDTTAKQLLASLVYDGSYQVAVYRNGVKLVGGVYLVESDTVVLSDASGKKLEYALAVVPIAQEDSNVIPPEYYTATAGAFETTNENTPPENAIDGDNGTMWHTPWSDTSHDNHYITITLDDDYVVTGYTYLPRQTGTNGIILQYEIFASDDNSNWESIAKGTWDNNNSLKTVNFTSEIEKKYFKLQAVTAGGDGTNKYASAAEIRLLGHLSESAIIIPDSPVNAKADEVSGTSAKVTWSAPENSEDIVKYVIKDGDDTIAEVTADETSYIVGGLEKNKEYTFQVYAVTSKGGTSEAAAVSFTTDSSDKDIQPVDKTNLSVKLREAEAVLRASKDEEVIKAIEAAITSAQKVFDNAEATQSEVDAAIAELNEILGIIDDTSGSVGDVDGSGDIGTNDVTLVLQYIAGIVHEGDEGYNHSVSDVTGDGATDTQDVTAILQFIATIITKFPAES